MSKPAVPDVPQCEPRDGIECRYADDVRYPGPARLDEVVGKDCTVHLEQMNDHDWSLTITGKGGELLMVNLYALKANVYAFAEWDGPPEPESRGKG